MPRRRARPVPRVERDFKVKLLVTVVGFGKEEHEEKLAQAVADVLHTYLGGEIEVERIPVDEIVLP
jgi:hypothetical protein